LICIANSLVGAGTYALAGLEVDMYKGKSFCKKSGIRPAREG